MNDTRLNNAAKTLAKAMGVDQRWQDFRPEAGLVLEADDKHQGRDTA